MTKKLHRLWFSIAVVLGLSVSTSLGQDVVQWVTLDGASKAGLPLPGVTVQVGCEEGKALKVLSTDLDGRLENPSFSLPCAAQCWATFSFVGYETVTLSCQRIEALGGRVSLIPQAEALDAVVVTASISSSVQEQTVPVTVLKPYLAETANALDLKGARVEDPWGVHPRRAGQHPRREWLQLWRGQPRSNVARWIASSVGRSGGIWWSYLPMEHVGQVEVVKATASSMYGSGAFKRRHSHAHGGPRERSRNRGERLQWGLLRPGLDPMAVVGPELFACVQRHECIAPTGLWQT